MASRPPSDAEWHITHGAPGPGEARAQRVQCVHSEEDRSAGSADMTWRPTLGTSSLCHRSNTLTVEAVFSEGYVLQLPLVFFVGCVAKRFP